MKHNILFGSILAAIATIKYSADTGGGTGTATRPSLTAEQLKGTNFGILVDKSGSMNWEVGGSGPYAKTTRWAYALARVTALLNNMLEVDPTGGIELAFFNDTPFTRSSIITVKSPSEIEAAFAANSPGGGTVMAPALKAYCEVAKESYAEGRNYQLYVITDGESSDKAETKATIKAQATITNQAQDEFFNIGFFQIGHDPAATKFLTDMDDGIAETGVVHDIVNRQNIDEVEGMSLGEIAYQTAND